MTEKELVRAAARGDVGAFTALVEKYQDRVYRLARRMCPGEAEDVTQEAFLSVWRALPSFRGDACFATWLYRLAANAAIDCLRRAGRERGNVSLDDRELRIDLPDGGPGPQSGAESAELREGLARCLCALKEEHREILLLREVQGLSYGEIASALRLEPGTVKSRLSRAREALREALLKNGNLSGYLPSNRTNGEGAESRA